MTDVTSICNSFSFKPARHIAWQKTADFMMKLGAFGFPITGIVFTHLFPSHQILGVMLCVFAPMAVGFGLQEWYQARRRLHENEKSEYHKTLHALQEQNPNNPIWDRLLKALQADSLSARQWYKLDKYFPVCVSKYDPAEPHMYEKTAIKHLKL